VPDNVLFEDGRGRELRRLLMDVCDLPTYPRSITKRTSVNPFDADSARFLEVSKVDRVEPLQTADA
jgi:hypothetical protein